MVHHGHSIGHTACWDPPLPRVVNHGVVDHHSVGIEPTRAGTGTRRMMAPSSTAIVMGTGLLREKLGSSENLTVPTRPTGPRCIERSTTTRKSEMKLKYTSTTYGSKP